MERMWSQFVQLSEELYRSRALRFRTENKHEWLNAMKIADGMTVLELGCGGGIFCHRIKEYLPYTTVTGLDRDAGHIEYAVAKTKMLGIDCKFVVGDVLALPFEDCSFDACTSHTVVEHVPTSQFISEQYRVLKPGGVVSVLSVRTGCSIAPEDWKQDDSEEHTLLNKAWEKAGNFDKKNNIGANKIDESQLPAALEKAGFRDVSVNFISPVRYAPDNADVNDELALEMINANRIHALSSMRKALNIAPDGLTRVEATRLEELINRRFDARVDMYLRGKKLWDMATGVVMAVTGHK